MLSPKLQDALNEQINFELYSAYVYFSMTAYFKEKNLNGFANWMHVQTMEEMVHVDKFFNFVAERQGRVKLSPIKGPDIEWASPLAAMQDAYKHETEVTRRIHKLVDLALAESDHASNTFLQWFVNEQVEEEANADAVVQQLKMVGNEGYGLFMIDRELATRVFVPPAAGAAA
ncbi:MAG: ferritin [Pseudomonadota bacterium]